MNSNRVAYYGGMSDPLDRFRDELRDLAHEADTLPARRDAAVARAREAGMTLTEAATILGMTNHGLRKSARQRAERASQGTK